MDTINILLIDDNIESDKKIQKIVAEIANCSFMQFKDSQQVLESLNPMDTPPRKDGAAEVAVLQAPTIPVAKGPHIFLVDVLKAGPFPEKWLADFREALKEGAYAKADFCFLSENKDPDYLRNYLFPGVINILIKPVMASILGATINHVQVDPEGQNRNLSKVEGTASLFYPVTVTELSEFDLKISTNKQVAENEIKTIYGSIFKWTPNQRVLARCMKCEEDPANKGSFVEQFSYVGVQPGITKEIRVWLKQEYIRQKSNG